MNPRVKSVSTTDDYQLEIVFINGDHGAYDCTPLLNFGVFMELKDEKINFIYHRQGEIHTFFTKI